MSSCSRCLRAYSAWPALNWSFFRPSTWQGERHGQEPARPASLTGGTGGLACAARRCPRLPARHWAGGHSPTPHATAPPSSAPGAAPPPGAACCRALRRAPRASPAGRAPPPAGASAPPAAAAPPPAACCASAAAAREAGISVEPRGPAQRWVLRHAPPPTVRPLQPSPLGLQRAPRSVVGRALPRQLAVRLGQRGLEDLKLWSMERAPQQQQGSGG
jgi:hypothetical protein